MISQEVFQLLVLIGLPLLSVLFLLEGFLIGKLLPTNIVLAGGVILWGSTGVQIFGIILLAVFASSVGQAVLFYLLSLQEYTVNDIPYMYIKTRRVERIDQLLFEYGSGIIFVTNCLPVIRGLGTIPASSTDLSVLRFTVLSVSSNLLYLSAVTIFLVYFSSIVLPV
jgi:membrane protein DedA with SNARE-associated domain